jgi:predicted nuclease of predicted toxin-antitoxin system
VARYFADECVAAAVVLELRAAGLDVVYAKEVCPGASDREVLRLAAEAGRVLVTDDLGFGELAVRYRQPAAGVILLSVYELPTGVRERYVAQKIYELQDGALGHLAVIEPGRLRLRPLPGRGP